MPSISSYLPKIDPKTLQKQAQECVIPASVFAATVAGGSLATLSDPRGYLIAFLATKCFNITSGLVQRRLPERVQKISLNGYSRVALRIVQAVAAIICGKKIAELAGYQPSFYGILSGTAVGVGTALALLISQELQKGAVEEEDRHVSAVNSTNFQKEVLEEQLPVVLDAYATWCGPCKFMAPIYAQLAQELKGKVKFVKFNVDRDRELTKNLDIHAMPTFIFFKDGKEIYRQEGGSPKEAFLDKIKTQFNVNET
jgi:thioredoxin 1